MGGFPNPSGHLQLSFSAGAGRQFANALPFTTIPLTPMLLQPIISAVKAMNESLDMRLF